MDRSFKDIVASMTKDLADLAYLLLQRVVARMLKGMLAQLEEALRTLCEATLGEGHDMWARGGVIGMDFASTDDRTFVATWRNASDGGLELDGLYEWRVCRAWPCPYDHLHEVSQTTPRVEASYVIPSSSWEVTQGEVRRTA